MEIKIESKVKKKIMEIKIENIDLLVTIKIRDVGAQSTIEKTLLQLVIKESTK